MRKPLILSRPNPFFVLGLVFFVDHFGAAAMQSLLAFFSGTLARDMIHVPLR